jgi:hypothetical protein
MRRPALAPSRTLRPVRGCSLPTGSAFEKTSRCRPLGAAVFPLADVVVVLVLPVVPVGLFVVVVVVVVVTRASTQC